MKFTTRRVGKILNYSQVKAWLSSFSGSEKKLIGFFAILAVIAGAGLIYQQWLATTKPLPVIGGIYREGIVAASFADIKSTIDGLTKIGFVKKDSEGNWQPHAAERWEVDSSGKAYTFYLKESIDMDVAEKSIQENQPIFSDIGIEISKQERKVIFNLKQPFAPFLATAAQPIFPFGSFEVTKKDKGVIEMVPKNHQLSEQVYLEQIVLKIYPDNYNLTQALLASEIDGVADVRSIEESPTVSLGHYRVELPRRIFLFFNTARDPFKTQKIRAKIAAGEALDQSISATIVTLASPRHEELARQVAEKWKGLGINATIDLRTAQELSSEIIPKRSYDALIYGLDFGADPDPYPFWHSSQIGQQGLNLANFANIDADRLLEKARQTSNVEERSKLYAQFDEIFGTQVPAIELEKVESVFGASSKVKGIPNSVMGIDASDRYDSVGRWYIKTKREKVE